MSVLVASRIVASAAVICSTRARGERAGAGGRSANRSSGCGGRVVVVVAGGAVVVVASVVVVLGSVVVVASGGRSGAADGMASLAQAARSATAIRAEGSRPTADQARVLGEPRASSRDRPGGAG